MQSFMLLVDAESIRDVVARLVAAVGEHYDVVESSRPTGFGWTRVIEIREKGGGDARFTFDLHSDHEDDE